MPPKLNYHCERCNDICLCNEKHPFQLDQCVSLDDIHGLFNFLKNFNLASSQIINTKIEDITQKTQTIWEFYKKCKNSKKETNDLLKECNESHLASEIKSIIECYDDLLGKLKVTLIFLVLT